MIAGSKGFHRLASTAGMPWKSMKCSLVSKLLTYIITLLGIATFWDQLDLFTSPLPHYNITQWHHMQAQEETLSGGAIGLRKRSMAPQHVSACSDCRNLNVPFL